MARRRRNLRVACEEVESTPFGVDKVTSASSPAANVDDIRAFVRDGTVREARCHSVPSRRTVRFDVARFGTRRVAEVALGVARCVRTRRSWCVRCRRVSTTLVPLTRVRGCRGGVPLTTVGRGIRNVSLPIVNREVLRSICRSVDSIVFAFDDVRVVDLTWTGSVHFLSELLCNLCLHRRLDLVAQIVGIGRSRESNCDGQDGQCRDALHHVRNSFVVGCVLPTASTFHIPALPAGTKKVVMRLARLQDQDGQQARLQPLEKWVRRDQIWFQGTISKIPYNLILVNYTCKRFSCLGRSIWHRSWRRSVRWFSMRMDSAGLRACSRARS